MTSDPTREALKRLASWDEMAGNGDPSEFPAMYRQEIAARINTARAALAALSTTPAPEWTEASIPVPDMEPWEAALSTTGRTET